MKSFLHPFLFCAFLLQSTLLFGAPYAYNASYIGVPAGKSTVGLYAYNVSGSPTYTIITQPSHGTITHISGNVFEFTCAVFTPASPYTIDTFTWKVTDATGTSGVATGTIYIRPNHAPVVSSPGVTAFSGARQAISISYSDNDITTTIKQTFTVKCTKLPIHGTLKYYDYATSTYKLASVGTVIATGTVPSQGLFCYTSTAGYIGTDSIGWSVSDGVATTTAGCSITVKLDVYGKDWPMYRRDEHRLAETSQDLGDGPLNLQWVQQLPPQLAAWPAAKGNTTMHYFPFDEGYEPIVIGHMMFVASTRTDSVTAYDTITGEQKWRFYTGAPVRLTPVGWKDGTTTRIYFGSDDGYFYCVNGATGAEFWKIFIGHSQRFFFCNSRLSSTSLSRGGAVVYQGKVYFAGGLVPFEGVYVYAVDAQTGSIVWKTDKPSLLTSGEPHSGPAVSGMAPQGWLVVSTDNTKVFVPNGHAERGAFELATGNMANWDQGGTGDTQISVFVKADGSPALTPYSPTSSYMRPGYPVQLAAGPNVYTTGPGVTGTVHGIIAADDRLFVTTKEGKIYCFAAASVSSPKTWIEPVNSLPSVSDQWTTLASQMLGDNPEGSCLVWGIGSGRLVQELAKQAKSKSLKLQINAFDPDAAKCNALRDVLDDAGLYGSEDANVRVSLHIGAPWEMEFPLYAARLVTSEDLSVAGFGYASSFVQKIFSSLRPYGGTAWLLLSSTEHTSFSGWISSLSLIQATTSRNGNFSLLTRNGALPNSTNFVNVDGSPIANMDLAAKPPFGASWMSDEFLLGVEQGWGYGNGPDVKDGKLIASSGKGWDVYTGLPLTGTFPWSGGKQIKSTDLGTRKNPFSNLDEERAIYKNWGCGPLRDYGVMRTFRSGSAAFYHAPTESGTVSLGFVRPGCDSYGSIPANGVLLMGGHPAVHHCDCPYHVRSNVALVNRADGFQNGFWGPDRSRRVIEEEPIRKVGFNFGTIGDRMENGVLWLHRPLRLGDTPIVPVTLEPSSSVQTFTHANSWIRSGEKSWVTSSGVKGAEQIKINLGYPSVVTLSCATPPTIDGNLNDACWNGQSELVLYGSGNGATKKIAVNRFDNGRIQFRYDDTKLYVGFNFIGDIAQATDAKAWDLFISDRSKAASKSCIHFRVDSAGTKYEAIKAVGAQEDDTWNGAWTEAYQKTTSNFMVEMSIPWSTITGAGFVKNDVVVAIQGPNCAPDNSDVLMLRKIPQGFGTDEAIWKTTAPKPPERFNPLSFNAPVGDLAKLRNYDITLLFSEPDDLPIGQRVFDIQIQGTTVASNVDIVKDAGGPRKSLVRKFTGIQVKDILDIRLVPKAGVPVICGIEAVESSGTSDSIAPSVPTALVAAAASFSQINLSWTASTDNVGVTGYKIFRGTTQVGTSTGTSYSDSGLTASTSYTYKVAAYDSAGNTSAQSTAASATTSAGTDTTAPTVPTGLSASAASSTQINLSWSASTDNVGVTGYKIFRGTTQIGTSTGTSYSDSGLSASTTYTYKVAACDAVGNTSAQSTAASATTSGSTSTGDSDGDGLPDSWELTYFTFISNSQATAAADPDGDGFTNEQEFKAGTSPVSGLSRLSIDSESFPTSTSFRIQWQSVASKTYEIQSSSNMTNWTTITNITATSTNTIWTNSGLSGVGSKFYRVRIP
jgi:outer membrane protein assembly factor BamB/chitodextrinase